MQIPYVDFVFREGGEFVTRTSKDLFSGKRVVLFALPGAFTPTCTEKQLPAYDIAAGQIKSKGIDEIYCLSVNDAFVMNAWFESLDIKHVKPLPDGNGEFTAKLGMAVQKTDKGMAVRSWRYAAVINDGNIEWALAEEGKRDNASEDPYYNSAPPMVLDYLYAKEKEDEEAAKNPAPAQVAYS